MKKTASITILLLSVWMISCVQPGTQAENENNVNQLLLKDFRPESIYKIPKTEVRRAKFPVIDIHSHAYAKSPEMVDEWVHRMDQLGILKTVILTGSTGTRFDSIYAAYAGRYPDRFEMWCGFDYTGYDEEGFGPAAVAELERCYKAGATGIGELGDKGKGFFYSSPGPEAWGMHADDPRMDPLWEKCADLNIPVSIHVADPIWMYQPMDSTNDGLMNAFSWRLDDQEGIVDNPGMLKILENAVKRHPQTIFIACHFANQSYDLLALGRLLDNHPNLYADISARYEETGAIPRFAARFYNQYQDQLLYGTDMGMEIQMYKTTFRILETEDEHFYTSSREYHWQTNGFALSDEVLEKLYHANAQKIIH